MIDEPKVKLAKNTDLRKAIEIGFDEAFTSLAESFHDLSDEQALAFPLEGHKNVAWIVMHSLRNLDEYGPYTLRYLSWEGEGDHRTWSIDWREYKDRFGMEAEPRPGDEFPPVAEMMKMLRTIESCTRQVLAGLSSEDLRKPVRDWWAAAADACMRTIWHTMAHVRQIWLLRGAMGWSEGQSRPRQHWA